ncbi:tetratricopeptide repeat protein [Portibacter marinus]|uniref:tetratricopeptide repeat protein n=1 Tax=Portibacter marinus TaxID=2898660 RepID=UPI001F3138EE|nr:tetratricopeptide repeat protein [Portibacter marinus]
MTERLETLLNHIEDSPNDGFLLFAIAKEYENIGEAEKALEYYEKLRIDDPKYVGLYYHLAGLYAELDMTEEALAIYEKGIQVAEDLKDLHALSELKGAKLNLELEL